MLAGACLLALGAAMGAVAVPEVRFMDGVDAATADAQSVEVTQTIFPDARGVTLTLVEGTSRPVRGGATGTVTSSSCVAGESLASGDVLVAVDGEPVVALATAVPLWRDLAVGDRGPDVDAVQEELVRLGYLGAPREELDGAAARAVRHFLDEQGRDVSDLARWWGDATLPLTAIAWLPQPSAVVATCDVAVGDQVSPDQALATLRSDGRALRLVEPPAADMLLPGPRTLTVGEASVPMADGVVTDPADLDTVLSTAEAHAWQDAGAEEPLAADYTLAEPIAALVVPPVAVVEPASPQPCLLDEQGRPMPVRIVASELGRTIVVAAEGGAGDETPAAVPDRVQLDRDGTATCG